MGFKTFTAGEVLTAANVNDYLMEQSVIQCTSATRPSSPNEGMTVYETDTDVYSVYTGAAWITALQIGAWTDYSGSLTWTGSVSNPAIGNGTITAYYARAGKFVFYRGRILMGSTTTFGSGYWIITLPVTARDAFVTGSAHAKDQSVTANARACNVAELGTTAVRFASGGADHISATVPFTWADTDALLWTVFYEAA